MSHLVEGTVGRPLLTRIKSLRPGLRRTTTTQSQNEVKETKKQCHVLVQWLICAFVPGRRAGAECIGGAHYGPVHQESFRTHQLAPSRSISPHPRLLWNEQSVGHADKRLPRLEGDVHLTRLVMGALSRLHRTSSKPLSSLSVQRHPPWRSVLRRIIPSPP